MDESLGARLGRLIEIAGLDFKAIDERAGLTEGHTGQIVRTPKPQIAASTVVALASVLGTTAEYLVTGKGAPPSERRVRRAVAEAAERRDSVRHAATVTPKALPRKVTGRSGSRRDRSSRAGGAP